MSYKGRGETSPLLPTKFSEAKGDEPGLVLGSTSINGDSAPGVGYQSSTRIILHEDEDDSCECCHAVDEAPAPTAHADKEDECLCCADDEKESSHEEHTRKRKRSK